MHSKWNVKSVILFYSVHVSFGRSIISKESGSYHKIYSPISTSQDVQLTKDIDMGDFIQLNEKFDYFCQEKVSAEKIKSCKAEINCHPPTNC